MSENKDPNEIKFNSMYEMIRQAIQDGSIHPGGISDGHHTFDELYSHRNYLFMVLAKLVGSQAWRSKFYSDGSPVQEGWFLIGVFPNPGAQISYHMPMVMWEEYSFVQEHTKAPDFDGHTHVDVLFRIKRTASQITISEHKHGRHLPPDNGGKPA